jgi:hypothetical protein
MRCRALAEHNMEVTKYDFAEADLLDPEDIADILKVEAEVTNWLGQVKDYALDQAVNHGEKFPGMKLVEGRSKRVIMNEDKLAAKLTEEGYKEIYKPITLKGITDLEKICGKKNFATLSEGLVEKPPGKPVLVPENDKRPEWAPEKEIMDMFDEEDLPWQMLTQQKSPQAACACPMQTCFTPVPSTEARKSTA